MCGSFRSNTHQAFEQWKLMSTRYMQRKGGTANIILIHWTLRAERCNRTRAKYEFKHQQQPRRKIIKKPRQTNVGKCYKFSKRSKYYNIHCVCVCLCMQSDEKWASIKVTEKRWEMHWKSRMSNWTKVFCKHIQCVSVRKRSATNETQFSIEKEVYLFGARKLNT